METSNTQQFRQPKKTAIDEMVYREQVTLLYQQLPIAVLSAFLTLPILTFMLWGHVNTQHLVLWLCTLITLNITRIFNFWHFKYQPGEQANYHRLEVYYLIGTVISALLWGSTSLWLNENSPATQQLVQIIIITGMTGGAVATLTPRIIVFRIFMILMIVPYTIRFIMIGTPMYYAITVLICIYMLLMFPVSRRINHLIYDSLKLRFDNLDLIDSYRHADQINKRANNALFEIMQKNKESELEIERKQTFLQAVLETANDSIITTDKHGIILGINHAIERDFGYREDEMLGKSINMIMEDGMGPKHDIFMEQYFNSDRPILVGRMLDVVGKRKNGSLFPMEITVSETRINNEIFFTGIIRDISERKTQESAMESMMIALSHAKQDLEKANTLLASQNQELTELSEHDALTGLPNRRYLRNAFAKEWPRHKRHKRPISVILIDVDFFKKYNDEYGHQQGDKCLKKIAGILKKNISRPADFVARYGGEEFIVVLPETDSEGAYHISEKMRLAIEQADIPHSKSKISAHITISGGVATIIPGNKYTSQSLIQLADEMLYEAKRSGRNCIRTLRDSNTDPGHQQIK